MLKTVRCYEIRDSKLLWEEMVTYDTDYWDYEDDEQTIGFVYYLGKSSQVPKKPEGMSHCRNTFIRYNGTYLDLSSFDTSNIADMRGMFFRCTSLQSLDLSNFDTSNVTDMGYMISYCESLQSLDLSSFNTSNVTTMDSMFYGCKSLKSLDLSSFNTSNVTDMRSMFSGCKSLQSLDLSNFDTSNVTGMSHMISYCTSLQSLDLSNFDTSNVTDMGSMFFRCESLQSLDLSSFNTSNVVNMSSMFHHCESLKSLDLSNFDTSNVTGMDGMFVHTNLSNESTGLGLFNKKPKTPNGNKGSIFDEIAELVHNGKVSSPTSLVKDLKNRGYSDSAIVSAIYSEIESGNLDRGIYMPVVNSYMSKVVIPTITKYFSGRSVGEVLDILYAKYPRVIVNEAMCSYLRPQYLVD